MITSTLENKAKAAYEHERMDYLAGAPCDPNIPLRVYSGLGGEQQAYIMESWANGWTDESLMQSLPDGMPAKYMAGLSLMKDLGCRPRDRALDRIEGRFHKQGTELSRWCTGCRARQAALFDVREKGHCMNEVITGNDIGLTSVKGQLLTVVEIAKFMRVSERWVRKHMADGTFPIRWFLLGERDRVVDSFDLDIWLSKTRIEAGIAPLSKKAERQIKQEVSA